MNLADAFIQSEFRLYIYIYIYLFFISMCVPWELNPQPFALLMQCSTTEPQEHMIKRKSSPDTRISTIDEMEDIHL